MHRQQGFALTDMLTLVVLGAIFSVYAYCIVGCGEGAQRRTARARQTSSHVRGIHSGSVLFAQGNKDFYPGLDSTGAPATKSMSAANPSEYGFGTADGSLVAYRMAVLLRGNYFSPEYMKSPSETNPAIAAPVLGKDFADGAAYSYAMLNITDASKPRTGEWRATNNSRAAVISDRNIGGEATGENAQSIHTAKGEGWRGSVCYNDNHANFETSDLLKTEYALKGEVIADQLFSDQEIADDGKTRTAGTDAAMVFTAGDSYVNQQP